MFARVLDGPFVALFEEKGADEPDDPARWEDVFRHVV
jgi:hypothetical protein